MAQSMQDIADHYEDLRDGCPENRRAPPLAPFTPRLLTELPFPGGVVPRGLLAAFSEEPDTDKRTAIATSGVNGRAIDSLIVLFRLFLLLGFREVAGVDRVVYNVAYHAFGRRAASDYIVKGKLADALYPTEADLAAQQQVTLGKLLEHPLVVRAFWSHPDMSFWRPETCALNSDGVLERFELTAKFLSTESPFRVGPAVDIGQFLSSRFGVSEVDGKSVVFSANMPMAIPVVMKGGRKFDDIRSFALTGPYYEATGIPVEKTCRYHLRAVLNLSQSDIRLYYGDTVPVIETIEVPGQEDSRQLKVDGRHSQSSEWTFADSPELEFLVLYERQREIHKVPYQPPNTRYPEYLNPMAFELTGNAWYATYLPTLPVAPAKSTE